MSYRRRDGWMDKLGGVAGAIVETVLLELVAEDGSGCDLPTDLRYDPADPYAVTAVFLTGRQPVRWTFARSLLLEGMHAPIGDGDVHVWPCLDARGASVVMIELRSPDGEVLVQLPTRRLTGFLARTVAAVPPGTEAAYLDVDGALRRLLPR